MDTLRAVDDHHSSLAGLPDLLQQRTECGEMSCSICLKDSSLQRSLQECLHLHFTHTHTHTHTHTRDTYQRWGRVTEGKKV